MPSDENDEKLLRSVALQNARAVLLARERAERDLLAAKEALERQSAELAEQREFFRVTLASIGDAVITCDTQARITFLNPVAEAMTGWTSDDAAGKPLEKIFNIINEQTRQPAPNPVSKVLRDGKIVGLANHTALLARDGTETAIDDSAAPIRDAAGNIFGVVLVFHDVTEQRSVEAALRASEERYRAIVQATPECVKVVAADGTLLAMNSVGCGMVEAESDADVLGKNVYGLIAPEFRDRFIAFNQRVCSGVGGQIDFQIVGLKGTRRWMESHGVPMRDPATGHTVQLAVTRDVTARKAAEEKLRRNEEELRALADSIAQLAWMADPDGQIFWYNRRWYEYTGTSFEQMAGWGWQALHDPEILPRVIERWKESLRTGSDFEMQFPLRGADGVYRWFLTWVRPVRNAEGKITRWFGTNTNIDEQRQLVQSLSEARNQLEHRVEERTEELKTANESLRKLSATLIRARDDEQRRLARELHDSVGQLLVAISMNITVVQKEAHKLSPSTAKCVAENAELVQEVSKEIRTMSHLLHPPLLDEVGLSSALRWYTEGFAERSQIKVDLAISPNLGRLPNDAEIAIFRIIQECLTNIHRHSESATAAIRIRREAGQLIVQVQDTGKGIPREKQRELIESSRAGVGIGGMRERLRQLGGTLEIQSEGKGTIVSAILHLT